MAHATRDRIVDAAARLFLERGFNGTSVASILDGCGVNSGSLYHFFASKEELAVAVLNRAADRLVDRLVESVEAPSSDPIDRVRAVFQRELSVLEAGDGGDHAVVLLLTAELGERRPKIRAAGERYHRALAGRVRRWLDEAGPRLPSVLDRSGMAEFIATVLAGGLARSKGSGSSMPLATASGQVVQYLVLLEETARRERLGEPPPAVGAPESRRPEERPGDWRSW